VFQGQSAHRQQLASFEAAGAAAIDVEALAAVAASLPPKRRADPFLAREVVRYGAQPLPSREYIIETLEEAGQPLTLAELSQLLEIRPYELALFERRLAAMARDGQILMNRRGAVLLPEKAALIPGRVQGHPDGFGFVLRDDGGPDIYLSPKEMRLVLHGDRVLVRIVGTDPRGRPEGKIVEVLERGVTRVVGRVIVEHGVMLAAPEDKRIAQDILIAPPAGKRGRSKVAPGDVVVVEIVEPPNAYAQPIGKIVEVLGRYDDPGIEIEIALRKFDLPFVWSSAAKAQTRRLPDAVRATDLRGRVDLRDLPFVTIDGENAKDFDDAVFGERVGKGFRLLVAIADVSHYVKPETALDQAAYERGNSVYFPRRVIPMLPEKLSNGLCSLVPHEDRLAMACEMFLSPRGKVERYRFFPAVIHSHARLTYTVVAKALYEGDKAARETVGELLPHLEALDSIFRVLLAARKRRGAIEFETTEVEFLFDDQGKIAGVKPVVRNDAHRLIEECMLAANVCASEFLAEHEHPTLYRVHEPPDTEKIAKLRQFLAGFGITLPGGDEPTPKDFARVLEQIAGRSDAPLLQMVILRSLKQARYAPENVGHFGLAYPCYTHFTSPIRRYPDLLVHRAIKAVLAGTRYVPKRPWEEIGMHCSMTERRADEATREVMNWLKCYALQEHIGEIFTGTVTAVVPFGLFVTLDDLFVEGLVHISDLGADYFQFDDVGHALIGERTRVRYRLADRVKVQVARADLATSRIDFRLIEKLDGAS
jgi:ribonuclease R